ncbi:MAG: hypothetical protein R3C59_05090 [Planctomycetaceae bacterium]
MKHNPHSLTSRPALAALAVSAVGFALAAINPVFAVSPVADEKPGETAADETADETTDKPAAPELKKSEFTADQVFNRVAETLDGVDSLSCDISQTVMLSGQKFQAVGRYVQASGNRMRLEYRLFPIGALSAQDAELLALDSDAPDVSDRKVTGSLEQVSDGSVLWSKWVNGPQKQLTRRNIREIVEAVGDLPNYSAARSLQDLGVGGLQTLMSQLQVGMDFGEVREQPAGETNLLVLAGRWNQKTRQEIFGLQDASAALPDYIPDYVRVYVDAAAGLPRRIQYLKKHPNPEESKVRPVVTLDLRNIKLNETVSDDTFQFDRAADDDIKEQDLTAQVIEGIKKVATPETPAAPEQPPAAQKK